MAVLKQYYTAITVSLGYFCCGSTYGWLPSLQDELHREGMSSAEIAWVLSVSHLGVLASAIPSGIASSKWGRKLILISSAPIFLASWIISCFYTSFVVLLIVRILQGIAMGMIYATAPVLIGEIAEVKNRGKMGVLCGFLWGLGLAYIYGVSPFVSYSILIWVIAPFLIIFFFALIGIPESPYSLLMRGKVEKARNALYWYREVSKKEVNENRKAIVEAEFEATLASVEGELDRRASWKDIFFRHEGLKAAGIMIVLVSFIILGGTTSILVHAPQGFSKLLNENNNGSLSGWAGSIGPVGVALVNSAGPLAAGCLVDKFGRRRILLLAFTSVSVSTLSAGIYYLLTSEGDDPSHKTHHPLPLIWIPSLALLISAFLQGLLIGITYPLRAELFQSSTRGVGCGIVTCTFNIISFISLRIFGIITEYLGFYSNFFMFAIVNIFGAVVMYHITPETKDRTFDEIQQLLKHQ